jgi:hypothetical protein
MHIFQLIYQKYVSDVHLLTCTDLN